MNSNFCKIGEQGYLEWQVESDISVMFEIPTEQIRPYLPKTIQPLEARPGVALLLAAVARFEPGCLNYLPSFSEPSIVIVVHNNLAKRDPTGKGKTPAFSFFVLNITATNKDFLKHAYLIDKMPVDPCHNLQVIHNGDNVKVYDDRGPILDLTFNYPDFKSNLFKYEEMFLQVYTTQKENLYYTPVIMMFKRFEHQKSTNGCRLYPHPFFQGLDVSNVGPAQMYMQNIADSSETTTIRFYTPELVRPLQGNEWESINTLIKEELSVA